MMNKIDPRYIRRLTPDKDGGYTATIHEFPGCIAEGDTAQEALDNLESVAESWIDSARSTGYRVSEPVDFEGASGKIALRISRRIHQQAAERAGLEGVSLNQLIGVAIASYLGQQDGMIRCAELVRDHIQATLTNMSDRTFILKGDISGPWKEHLLHLHLPQWDRNAESSSDQPEVVNLLPA